MDQFKLQLFEKTSDQFEIRCFDGETLLSQDSLPSDELKAFIEQAEKEYAGPVLMGERLGRDLYDWLERVTGGVSGPDSGPVPGLLPSHRRACRPAASAVGIAP